MVKIFYNNNINNALILKTDLTLLKNRVDDWVSTAESLINTPYKWGDRSSIKIDCSALIQVSLNTAGIRVPRNNNLQMNFKIHKQFF